MSKISVVYPALVTRYQVEIGKEKSRIAHMQVEQILDTWKAQIVRGNLLASQVPANVARPRTALPQTTLPVELFSTDSVPSTKESWTSV